MNVQVRGSIVYLGSMVKVIACVVWMHVVYNASMIPYRSACWCSLSCGSERIS